MTSVFQTVVVLCALSATLGRIIVPGLRGNAPERLLLPWEQGAAVVSYLTWMALTVGCTAATLRVSRMRSAHGVFRMLAMASAGVAMGIVFRSIAARLETSLAVLLVGATFACTATGSLYALREKPTRAVAIAVMGAGFAAVARVVAWQLASVAGEKASLPMYETARSFATAGVALEGVSQLLLATWLGTRSRVGGQLPTSLAIAAAFAATWAAARGGLYEAPLWQVVFHHGLVDAAGAPPPFRLGAIATFLVPCGTLLAVVAAFQRRTHPLVSMGAAFCLLGHGTYDVPLRALCACLGGLFLFVAAADPRALFQVLTGPGGPPPADDERTGDGRIEATGRDGHAMAPAVRDRTLLS